MSKQITLSGYYGFRNAGDDAVCYAILEALRNYCPEAEPVVLSNDPEETERRFGVRAVNRWHPYDIITTLASSDLLISGGGSLLQDITSRNGILYYLGVLEMAYRLRIPTLIYAQGIGPIQLERNRGLTARALNKAACVTVRDDASKRFLKDIGVQAPLIQTADPVLGIHSQSIDERKGMNLLKRAGCDGAKPIMLVALRSWGEKDRVLLFAQAFDQAARDGYDVVFLAMQHTADSAISMAVAGHMEEKAYVLTDGYDTPTLFALTKCADVVVGMRLHALIIGAACGKRLMALSYDPKIDAFMHQVDRNHLLSLQNISVEAMTAVLKQIKHADPPDVRRMNYLARLADLPAQLAAQIMKSAYEG